MADKVEPIKEEIERLYAEVSQKPYNGEIEGEMCAYDKLISFIDSLPEEPASEDLEKEIDTFFSDWLINLDEHKDFVQIARHFAEWQKHQIMKNVVETTIVKDCQYDKDHDYSVIPAIHQRIEGFDVGDKVKIIIIKNE